MDRVDRADRVNQASHLDDESGMIILQRHLRNHLRVDSKVDKVDRIDKVDRVYWPNLTAC